MHKNGYYGIAGSGMHQFEFNGKNYADSFLYLPEMYASPYEQALTRWRCEMRREIRIDLHCEASILAGTGKMASAGWAITLSEDGRAIVVSGNNHWNGVLPIEYLGDTDMWSPYTALKNCTDETIAHYKNIMADALQNGDPRVRIARASGQIIFSESVTFPRWRSSGEWWSSENRCLDTNVVFATEQMQAAGLLS